MTAPKLTRAQELRILGNRLRKYRLAADFRTQADLAFNSGVGQGSISAYERGRRPMHSETAKLLAASLDVHPSLLLFVDLEDGDVVLKDGAE